MLSEFKLVALIKHAYQFVDVSTIKCPVCDFQWPAGDLESHLAAKIAMGRRAEVINQRIMCAANAIGEDVKGIRANLNSLIDDLEVVGVDATNEHFHTLDSWRTDLDELNQALEKPLNSNYADRYSEATVSRLCAPLNWHVTLDWVEEHIVNVAPPRTPEQTAWDLLTRLGESVGTLENRREEHENGTQVSMHSQILLNSFQQARDKLLQDLYSRVSSRFVEFYGMLHEHERSHFSAELQPYQASLKFEVDFLGRGTYPPQALHSEGHQDSMGLCLFFSLNEELAGGNPTLVLLDDVMMSVDSGHRKEVCRLLRERFPDCQFVITTHDKTWATQLRQEGCVERQQVIEFTGWDVETGPKAHIQKGSLGGNTIRP